MKPQHVRLADVFIFGPLIVWGGWKLQDEYPLAGRTLVLTGIGTVIYNGLNYMQVQREGAIPGGTTKGPGSFNQQQLRIGTEHEMEHTSDPDIAREIAMDHLDEDPQYYVKLERAGL
jgi:hypothetical protein